MYLTRSFKWLISLMVVVLIFGFTGCSSDDDDPPESIAGAWSCIFTRTGSEPKQETWSFAQNGQQITGTYTYGDTSFTFTGTYVDGTFTAVDSDNWVLNLNFKGDSSNGTIAGVTGDGESQVWNAMLSR